MIDQQHDPADEPHFGDLVVLRHDLALHPAECPAGPPPRSSARSCQGRSGPDARGPYCWPGREPSVAGSLPGVWVSHSRQ